MQPMRPNRRSMYFRIMMPLVLIIFLTLTASIFAGFRFVQQAFEREYYSAWDSRTFATARTLGPVLNASDRALAIWIGEALAQDEQALFVQIENLIGDVIFEESNGENLPVGKAYEVMVLSPLDGFSRIGVLRVSVGLPELPTHQAANIALVLIWPLGVLSLLAASIFVLIRWRVLLPLTALHRKVVLSGEESNRLRRSRLGFGAVELDDLDAAFVQTFRAINEKENFQHEILRERSVLFDAADKALKSMDKGMICLGIGQDRAGMRMGVACPQMLAKAEQAFLAGAINLDDVLSNASIRHIENPDPPKLDFPGRISHIIYEAEVDFQEDVSWKVTIIRLAVGTTALIFRDISKEINFRRQMGIAQKNETVGRLTGGVAHDFNNLLNVILGNLELFIDEHPRFREEELLLSSFSAAKRGGQLTRSLLSFARESKLKEEMIDLNEHVRQTLKWVTRILPNNISVEMVLAARLWPVMADIAMVESTLLNLVINARDAMPDGGKLTINTANIQIKEDMIMERGEKLAAGDYVIVSIADDGVGISREIFDKIFDPYFTTKQAGKGSGVGLSMVFGFMKQSKGAVRVESVCGVGTEFKLLFPAARTDEAVPEVGKIKAVRPTRGSKILLVDDDEMLRKILEKLLVNAGYRVEIAADGEEGLRKFTEIADIDIVLTDMVMPGPLTGPMMAEQIRQKNNEIPVIFMSGYAPETADYGKLDALRGAKLTKPVSRRQLLDAIEQALHAK